MAKGLTSEQISSFHKNGYLLLPGELAEDGVQALLNRSHQLLEEFSLEGHPMTKFTTGVNQDNVDGGKHIGDDYFLSSGDKIRFFFEEGMNSSVFSSRPMNADAYNRLDAFDKQGNLMTPKERAINKIGVSPFFFRCYVWPDTDIRCIAWSSHK